MPTLQTHAPVLDDSALDEVRAFERRQRFWPRFGLGPAGPDFTGQKILEVGSGLGERCLDVAARGARRVVGVDPFAESITAARQALTKYPALAGVVEYRLGTVHELAENDFDAVVSENTFEHVLDVPETLAAIRARLR